MGWSAFERISQGQSELCRPYEKDFGSQGLAKGAGRECQMRCKLDSKEEEDRRGTFSSPCSQG